MQRLLPDFGAALSVFNNSRDRLDLARAWDMPQGYSVPEMLSPSNCWALKRGKPHLNLAGSDNGNNLPGWWWGKDEKGQWRLLDTNSASDADLWFAYALTEAARRGPLDRRGQAAAAGGQSGRRGLGRSASICRLTSTRSTPS